MAKIVWTEESLRWLEDIFEFIAQDNPQAAAQTVDGIYERVQALVDFPELGQRYAGSQRHVRILLYGHYRVAYLVEPAVRGGPGNRDNGISGVSAWRER
jgi:plasmid stabilization system protein ParE